MPRLSLDLPACIMHSPRLNYIYSRQQVHAFRHRRVSQEEQDVIGSFRALKLHVHWT